MKSRRYVKIVSALIAVAVSVSAVLSGCDCNNDSQQQTPSVTYTDYKIIENGTSNYKIVVSEDPELNESYAADEIVNFVYEASGVLLPVVTDSSVEYTPEAKLIVLGDTALNSNSGINASELEDQFYTVKTVDSNLFITGGNDLGTLYGAYDFLHYNFGYEFYDADEIAVDRNVTDRNLADFDLTDGPDIKWRQPPYGPADSALSAPRFRFNQSPWIFQNGNWIHNSLSEYLPYSQYGEEHGKWYENYDTTKSSPSQLCYTAHGDGEELAAMQDAVVARMQQLINLFFSRGEFKELISFTHEDNGVWCECAECTARHEEYGTHAAAVIQFVNPVAERIESWLEEEWPGHTVTIAIFAYQQTLDAPVKQEGDSFVPIDESVRPAANVTVIYAPYYAEFGYDFNHSKNATYMNYIKRWHSITERMSFWFYSANYTDYLAWYDTFNSMIGNYKIFKDYGAYYLFDQGRYDVSSLTGFDNLKTYLISKFSWDVNSDFDSLVNDYFANYFRQAAEPMLEYFESFRTWMQIAREELGMSSSCRLDIYSREYFPKQVLLQWLGYIEEAYAAIQPVQNSDPALYTRLYDRITEESIAIRYHLIDFYGNTYNSSDNMDMKVAFKRDADALGFVYLSEAYLGITLNEYVYEPWGLV